MSQQTAFYELNPLVAALETLRAVHPAMTINQALVFLLASTDPKKYTQASIAQRLDLPDGSISRISGILSSKGDRATPALDLLQFVLDPIDGRMRYMQLTAKGAKIAAKMVAELKRIKKDDSPTKERRMDG